MSTVHHQTFAVPYAFDVHFTRDVFAPDNDALVKAMHPRVGGRPARALIYVDEGAIRQNPKLIQSIHLWFAAHEADGVQLAAAPEVIPGGEALKGEIAILDKVGRACFDNGICRHSYIIIIGGGAVLDAVGFAASIVHRGIRQIRLPTTVLAQCDAGLGVKNGVNRFGSKNFYGTFTPPSTIINDARFLESLDDRSWRAGIAEAVKVAIIKDAEFLVQLGERAVMVAELDLEALIAMVPEKYAYHPVSRYQAALRDVAVVVGDEVTNQQVEAEIREAGGSLLRDVRLFDVYRGANIAPNSKSLAYALSYQADDRTLGDKEIEKAHLAIEDRLRKSLKATIRGKDDK